MVLIKSSDGPSPPCDQLVVLDSRERREFCQVCHDGPERREVGTGTACTMRVNDFVSCRDPSYPRYSATSIGPIFSSFWMGAQVDSERREIGTCTACTMSRYYTTAPGVAPTAASPHTPDAVVVAAVSVSVLVPASPSHMPHRMIASVLVEASLVIRQARGTGGQLSGDCCVDRISRIGTSDSSFSPITSLSVPGGSTSDPTAVLFSPISTSPLVSYS